MARLNLAPTKSNLLKIKEQLAVAEDGYELLEQKREILVMELMHLVEKVKLLEQKIKKKVKEAYPELKKMLMTVGGDRVERISKAIHYDFTITEKTQVIGGMTFNSIDVQLPKKQLFYSYTDSFANTDKVMSDFFDLLALLTEMASIRTIVWRLATEVKKTQRRVNALDKMVIPQNRETKKYIEGVLEEKEIGFTIISSSFYIYLDELQGILEKFFTLNDKQKSEYIGKIERLSKLIEDHINSVINRIEKLEVEDLEVNIDVLLQELERKSEEDKDV